MSLFRRLILVLGAGGAGYQPEWRKDANIFSAYNLCSTLPFERLIAQLTSAYNICVPQDEYLTATPTSVYDLSTALT